MSPKLSTHRYASAVLSLYKDKEVEINTGEVQTSLTFSDWETGLKHIIRGIVRDVIGDALIIECKTRFGPRKILINAWSITAVVATEGGVGMKDFYSDEHTKIGNK